MEESGPSTSRVETMASQHELHRGHPTAPSPQVDALHPLHNAEGEEFVAAHAHAGPFPLKAPSASDEKMGVEAGAGTNVDVEAYRSSEESEEARQGKISEKWNLFRKSKKTRVARDFLIIALILGWWIPGVIRKETRHYWVITSIWSWFFILLILLHNDRYVSKQPFIRGISAVWGVVFAKPWDMLPYMGKLAFGWIAVLAIFLGSAFGIKPSEQSPYKWRAVSLCGLVVLYGFVYMISTQRRAVKARTTILGLIMQCVLGLLVFKTGAGLSAVTWAATAAADLLLQGQAGGARFFWRDFVDNGYFFVNTLSSIIFFVAFVTALYYSGVMSWVLRKFSWVFVRTFGISGAEAVVAAASPFIGQGENVLLTKPYVKHFTDAEMHQVLTSGFATIAGSVFVAYVQLGVPAKDLLTSSMMSIPAAISLSKLSVPETRVPLTMNEDGLSKGDEDDESVNLLHAFSNGAWLGVKVAGLIFCNVLCIVSALYTVNGLLAWIGQFWGIDRSGVDSLSIELIGSYLLYPITFLLGVPPADILPVARLISTKVVANEFVAFDSLSQQLAADPLFISPRAQLIARYALCGFGNIASAGINIGILCALAPTKSAAIIRLTPRALLTGIIATLSTACVAGVLGDS